MVEKESPRIELVVVNYNTDMMIRDFLVAHVNNKYPNYGITVVDNASLDSSWDVIREAMYVYPDLLDCQEEAMNWGYGTACNRGAARRRDKADYFVFMNSDVFPPLKDEGSTELVDWITPLVETFEREEHVGVVAPKLLFPYDKTLRGHAVLGTNAEPVDQWYWQQPDGPRYNKQLDAVYVSGACFMIPHDLFFGMGMFDEYYFHYKEEMDLMFKLRKEGYRVICNPESVVYHLHMASNQNKQTLEQYNLRSSKYFVKKWENYLKSTTRFTEEGVYD